MEVEMAAPSIVLFRVGEIAVFYSNNAPAPMGS